MVLIYCNPQVSNELQCYKQIHASVKRWYISPLKPLGWSPFFISGLYDWHCFLHKCGTYLIEALFLVSGTEGVGFYEERKGGEVCSANWSQLTAECFDAKPFIRSCS